MIIFSGDEYQCIAEYVKQVKSFPLILRPKLFILRNSSQDLPENENCYVITAGFIHKKAIQVFDYIKVGQDYQLNKFLPAKYVDYAYLVPTMEVKDLKSGYPIIAYDLMAFANSIIPFINNLDSVVDFEQNTNSVFEFCDLVLGKNFKKIISKYGFVFEEPNENYFWVLNDAIDTCMKIKSGKHNNIHAFKLKKYQPLADKLSFEELAQLKSVVKESIETSRQNCENFEKSKSLLLYALR